ncbi:Chaperonin Cpn10 [Perkinsela sp. CCAP 1560/4]|nr:Chaperonin Cpn10 [Perkinsela sp. CCAP 1560/4]|eukprot:KNH05245.1 Chaperonin Cpn10 [Perkinsela sp. CCAP 1560/4]
MFSTGVLHKSFTPLGKRVLVRRSQAAAQTTSGILIPEQSQGKLNEGVVIAVPQKVKNWKPSVKVGDCVLLSEFGGTEVNLNGVQMHLFSEDQLLGVIQK